MELQLKKNNKIIKIPMLKEPLQPPFLAFYKPNNKNEAMFIKLTPNKSDCPISFSKNDKTLYIDYSDVIYKGVLQFEKENYSTFKFTSQDPNFPIKELLVKHNYCHILLKEKKESVTLKALTNFGGASIPFILNLKYKEQAGKNIFVYLNETNKNNQLTDYLYYNKGKVKLLIK